MLHRLRTIWKTNFLLWSQVASLAAICIVFLFSACIPKRIISNRPLPVGEVEPISGGFSWDGAQRLDATPFLGARSLWAMKDGTILIVADMDIDADGSPRALELDPRYGQLCTSLCYPDSQGQAQYIDSERIPYFVLPLGFAEEHGLQLGDIGAVVFRDRIAFGIYADNGPGNRMGEVSLKLSEDLGHAPWKYWHAGESLSTHGGISTRDILYMIYPGTRPAELNPETLADDIQRIGAREFQERGGVVPGFRNGTIGNRHP